MWEFEQQLKQNGCSYIAGVDEVGRGPLAGPVVACAVMLPHDCSIDGVNDSKQLTEKQRIVLFEQILKLTDVHVGLGVVSQKIIDRINIFQATKVAMREAINNLAVRPEHLLVDGLYLDKCYIPQTKLIKGDSRSASIAAASIIAKIFRDALMVEYDNWCPGYQFARHKGYGTRVHLDALAVHGVSELHRKSFAPVQARLLEGGN